MAIYWPRLFTVPIGLITFMMAGFAFIGAQKAGTATRISSIQKGSLRRIGKRFWKRLSRAMANKSQLEAVT